MKYKEFLKSKYKTDIQKGIEVDKLNKNLFDFQEVITKWALKRARAQ